MDDETRRAQIRRLDAERIKLELEAKEIERRLNSRWWEEQKIVQYSVSTIIATALLFIWFKGVFEPLLNQRSELASLKEQKNAADNTLLEAKARLLEAREAEALADRDKISNERDRIRLEKENAIELYNKLENKRKNLELIVFGLKVAAEQIGKEKIKVFSFMNERDPIYFLREHGWEVYSDNYWNFGKYGYYIVTSHPRVMEGRKIILVRIYEFEEVKKENGNVVEGKQPWEVKLDRMIARDGPVIILDYTYFGLLADKNAPVGGLVFGHNPDLRGSEFYAPLSEWSDRLGPLLESET